MWLMASKERKNVGCHSGGFTRQLDALMQLGCVLSGDGNTASGSNSGWVVNETRGGCIWDMADAVSVGGLLLLLLL